MEIILGIVMFTLIVLVLALMILFAKSKIGERRRHHYQSQ